jgi:hypothetical protein
VSAEFESHVPRELKWDDERLGGDAPVTYSATESVAFSFGYNHAIWVVKQELRHLKADGVPGAMFALADLRAALGTIVQPHPAYRPGHEPTAADACAQVLEMLEHGLHQISRYLGEPL